MLRLVLDQGTGMYASTQKMVFRRLFAYSIEVDEANTSSVHAASALAAVHERLPHKKAVSEMISCIDVTADFEDGLFAASSGRRTWLALRSVRALVVYSFVCAHTATDRARA